MRYKRAEYESEQQINDLLAKLTNEPLQEAINQLGEFYHFVKNNTEGQGSSNYDDAEEYG